MYVLLNPFVVENEKIDKRLFLYFYYVDHFQQSTVNLHFMLIHFTICW